MTPPAETLAHGVGEMQDLPLPLDLVLQAGALTVVASFLAVIVLWRVPREFAEWRVPAGWDAVSRSRWWRIPLRAAGAVAAVDVGGHALIGPAGEANPAAHVLFVWRWVGIMPVSIVFGPVWRVLNPLRTLHALLCRILRLPPTGLRPGAGRTGQWPAAVALLAFVWFELVPAERTDPRVVGAWLLGYALIQLGGAVVRGREWFARADAFEVYSELAGRLSALGRDADGRLVLRSPLAGLTKDPATPGTMAFIAVWWGSTIFDSASGSPAWIGLTQASGLPWLVSTAGLVGVCVIVTVSLRLTARRTDLAFSLIPIAAAYTLAHYASLLIIEGPRGFLLFGQQWGLTDAAEAGFVPAPSVIAILQVVFILAGHLLGVLAAHDRMLRADPDRPITLLVAEEMPSVLLMVGYTWAGIFLLFAA